MFQTPVMVPGMTGIQMSQPMSMMQTIPMHEQPQQMIVQVSYFLLSSPAPTVKAHISES